MSRATVGGQSPRYVGGCGLGVHPWQLHEGSSCRRRAPVGIGWRPGKKGSVSSPEESLEALTEIRQASAAPASATTVESDEADFLVIKRALPVGMGKWRVFAQDVAERSWAAEQDEAARQGEPIPPNPGPEGDA